MELLRSLAEVLGRRTLSEAEALEMMTDLCNGLERCEKEGILHRDIKMENILITPEGRARLGDFGIAGKQETADCSHAIQGTFSCMAPETFHGKRQDQRTDLYSLGMVFYQVMNEGREPFVSAGQEKSGYREREVALKQRMQGRRVLPPENASPEFGRILQKACAFRPDKRYQNAASLRRALERCRRNRKNRILAWIGDRSKKQWAAAAVVLSALICAFGIMLWWQMPLLEYNNSKGNQIVRMSRGGTLILDGPQATVALRVSQSWPKVRDRVKNLVIQGDVRVLDAGNLEMKNLENIEFPEGLERIQKQSFAKCEKLQEIQFPSSLKIIEAHAFRQCTSLKAAEFPEGIEIIEDFVLTGCESLVRVEIPSSVMEIGKDAFAETPWYERKASDREYVVINNILVDYQGGAHMNMPEELGIRSISARLCYDTDQLQSVTLADTVEKIGEHAFSLNTSLKKVTLSKNLKEVTEQAFSECRELEEVIMPEGVERIGNCAFYNDENLKKIQIPETVTSVGKKAFEGTAWYNDLMKGKDFVVWNGILLECLLDEPEIVIPRELGIRYIADNAFENKRRLKKVVIPEGVVSIGAECFYLCRNLEEIRMPESLTEIGPDAMKGTKWMENQKEEAIS